MVRSLDPYSDLVALTCRLGNPLSAISFKNFHESLDGLGEYDAGLLRAAWMATCDVADGDSGKEIRVIRAALCRLRDELRGTDANK